MQLSSLLCGAALGAAVILTISAATPAKTSDVLKVRKLIIEDEKGVERIVIAAPVPDPLVRGKRIPRRSAANGIQINDSNGNERGGIVMLDDGSFIVGIDDDSCRERAHMYFIPKKGSGIFLQDGKEHANISLLIPDGGTNRPQLTVSDEAGKVVYSVPTSR